MMQDGTVYRRALPRDGGVALITVIVVLLALVVIATPFSISMRNHSESSTDLLNRARVLRECEALRNIGMEALKNTHPVMDMATPHFDDEGEWELDLDELPLSFNTSDPKGKIWSLRSTDLQGRINLNGASLYLLANLLGKRTHLVKDMEDGLPTMKVVDTAPFPEAGLLWIEGEGLLYTTKTEDTFEDLDREIELANIVRKEAYLPLYENGTEVIGLPAFLIATYCYKWLPGRVSDFPTIESIRNIAVYGEESLARDDLDRIEDLITVNSGFPKGRRFVNPQRILTFGEDELRDFLVVENGRYVGKGSIVRVRWEEEVHYSLVIRVTPLGDRSWSIQLQDEVPFEVASGERGMLDVLARAPVNINTAPPEVLEALVRGLSLSDTGKAWVQAVEAQIYKAGDSQEQGAAGQVADLVGGLVTGLTGGTTAGGRRVGAEEARSVAAALAEAPVESFLHLRERLEAIAKDEVPVLSRHQVWAIMLNALNSQDALLEGGTAPFCFSSEGCFCIDTAVSDNYADSGREKARQFMRDIAWVAPSDALLALFTTQEDFTAQQRLSREGRHYVTLPTNLNNFEGENRPPSMAPSIMRDHLAPSGEVEPSGLQLAPVRMEGERCLHFDGSDSDYFGPSGSIDLLPPRAGNDPDPASDYPLGYLTGDRILYCDPLADPVAILGGPYARVWPFSVELWYRFDELNGEHLIFDCGEEGREEHNRIYLFHDGKELHLRVADVTLPTSSLNSDEPIEHTEITYDFSDLPLEKDVFYHITCMVGGSKPSDLALFVDGVPRGERSFLTRLKEPLGSALDGNAAPGARGSEETLQVEDASSFPSRGVLRVGREIIEYSAIGDGELVADYADFDPFGGRGRRGSIAEEHPETEIVELYGYTCSLRCEVIPKGDVVLGNTVGPFQVAMVDPTSDNFPQEMIQMAAPEGGYAPVTVGKGFFTDSGSPATIPLVSLNRNDLGDEGEDMFSNTGGYAIAFTEFPDLNFDVIFQGADQPDTVPITISRGDGGRPRTDQSTTTGYYINGFAVFHYDHFSGSSLEGITWGNTGQTGYPSGRPEALMQWAEGDEIGEGDTNFIAKRCFVTEYANDFLPGDHSTFGEARVFVFPISVKLDAGQGDLFEEFFPSPNSLDNYRPELIQLDIDFNGTGEGETEWIRYNSIEGDIFCRDDPRAIQETWTILHVAEVLQRSSNLNVLDIQQQVLRLIDFRGQHGTTNGSHSPGASVLPVFQVDLTPINRPGRHDNITIVSDLEDTEPEAGTINHVNSNSTEDGGPYQDRDHGFCALIGLTSGVAGDFMRQDFDMSELRKDVASGMESGEGGVIGDALSTAWGIESRDMTRIVKFPSGELPTQAPETFILGGNILGEPSPSQGCIDEVRFKSFNTPNIPPPELPRIARFVLERELEEDEDDQIELMPDGLFFNRHLMRNSLLEAFQILKSLPEDAGLLLIGDELIAYTDVDWEDGIITIAPNGRGMLGTDPGYHRNDERVVLLNFPELSIMDGALREEDATVYLKDPAGFPFEGAVLIDQEVIGYSRRESNVLVMPDIAESSFKAHGLLRGRYGTQPAAHPAGSVVYNLPLRYRDLYMPGADMPEAAYFPFSIAAPGGYYDRITWIEKSQGPGAELVVQARVGGRGDWAMAPEASKDIFLFEKPDKPTEKNRVGRQGDRLELRIHTRFKENAFDPFDFASNAWKYSPVLKTLVVEYVQPTRIVRHEEWR